MSIPKLDKRETGYLVFGTNAEALIWNNCLTGQISDGAWENDTSNNWRHWCKLKVGVSGNNNVGRLTYDSVRERGFKFYKELVSNGDDILFNELYITKRAGDRGLHFNTPFSRYTIDRLLESNDEVLKEYIETKDKSKIVSLEKYYLKDDAVQELRENVENEKDIYVGVAQDILDLRSAKELSKQKLEIAKVLTSINKVLKSYINKNDLEKANFTKEDINLDKENQINRNKSKMIDIDIF